MDAVLDAEKHRPEASNERPSPGPAPPRKARSLHLKALVLLVVAGLYGAFTLYGTPSQPHEQPLQPPVGDIERDTRTSVLKPREDPPLRIGDLKWEKCTGEGELPEADCGYAIVPLDYANPRAGTAKIALARYPARNASTRKGIVIMNPGGPGGAGKPLASMAGPRFQSIIGEDFDLVAFDPRGIGETEPRTQCFPSAEAREAFIKNTVLDRSYDVGPNLTDPLLRAELIAKERDARALYKTELQICAQKMGEQLKYMGTTTVVRDIDFLTTLLEGKDALINFLGFSYGTIMGQYLVNMFPDRVGRVVIDGVEDADEWANVPSYKWYRHWLTSTEDTYRIWMEDCAKAGPSACALAKSSQDTADIITERVEAFLTKLYHEPLAAPNATVPGILTNGLARLYMTGRLTKPTDWPKASRVLAAAMDGDVSELLGAASSRFVVDLERSAVSCSDARPYPPPRPEEVIDEALYTLEHVSRFALGVVTQEPDAGCEFWPVTPPERFLGPWNHTLRNPILIVSNKDDPLTPLSAGKIVQKTLGDSARLLIQDSPGHVSINLPSLCTGRAVRAYFANGTLPDVGTVCPVDASPFPSSARVLAASSSEDDELLAALREAGEALSRAWRWR